MDSSPERISSGAAGTALAWRPMARRSRASSSAGPAVASMTSSAPHSAVTAARPPSVSTARMGTCGAARRSNWQSCLAEIRSRRASTRIASAAAASSNEIMSAGPVRTVCNSRPSAGMISTGGSAALVSRNSSLILLPPPPYRVWSRPPPPWICRRARGSIARSRCERG